MSAKTWGLNSKGWYMADEEIARRDREALLYRWIAEGLVGVQRSSFYKPWTIYTVGGLDFHDEEAQRKGGFPTETLIANLALAIDALPPPVTPTAPTGEWTRWGRVYDRDSIINWDVTL